MKKLLILFFLILSFSGFSQSATEVFYPKYVQGVGSGSPSNDLRVPYACRMTVNGLTPNATYRFFTGFTENPASTNNGATGAMILANQSGNFTRIVSLSVGTAGEYGEFTTNSTGSFTGWFILEPSSDIIFTPGNLLYWRIMLNNGAGGVLVTTRITATNPITVINWGFTSGAPLQGSAIYNVANAAWTPRNFVMLYDNIAGTGRPVTGTFIENDGTNGTTAEFYDLWYEFFVNGFNNVWGTIIPNNLANGINNISQYALSNGNFVNKCTSPNGVYGATDTRNASTGNDAFGTLLIIDCTPAAGCNITTSTVITHVNCFGQSTGAVNLTVTGATPPVTYLWSNAATTEDLTNVPAGTYTVTITDAASCTATTSATVTQPAAALSATAVGTNVLCFGASTGSINLTVSGGTIPYTYLWSNSATTEDISGLVAGTYSVTVTDYKGCTATTSVTITQPASALTATAVGTNVLCFGQSTGSVNLTVSGGTSPYTYLWSNGATTEDISGLTAGTYSVTVTDANSCTATASATITQPASALTASATATNATCGASNGSVNLTVSGGTVPYTYLWSNGATTEDISGLPAGTYTVTVTDANGCTTTASATVNNTGGPTVTVTSTTNVLCFGASTGAINITVSGGTSPYTYLWSNGATTEDISSLLAGTYTVTVTDAGACTATASAIITQPTAITANATATNATCGASNGSVNLTVSGGTVPYTYLWSNGATTEDISGLSAGTYTVTVTDANGCTKTASAVVSNTGGPTVTVTSTTNVLCFGQSTGSVNLTVSGGTSPYTYLWSNGATTEDISGLTAGTYSVTVTDANSCTATASATITQPASALTASATATNATCGASNGSVNLTVSGGTVPYTYLWSNGATTEDISGLPAGTYTVTVTDANGCTTTASATVNNTGGPTVTVTSTTNVLCFGASTGAINITVSGGTSPYTYLWSNGATTEDISSLLAGTYTVTVTDAGACTATASAIITQPTAITANATATNATCGASNGSVNLTVSGGTVPYTYLWSNGATTEDISGLSAGTYTVTVTDANGCTKTASAVVSNTGGPTVTVTSTTNVLCFGQSTGSVNLTVSGGTSPYTYLWSNGATTEDISGLTAGTYSVTVTDANSCTATASATITQPASALTASATATNATCGASNGSVNLTVSGGTVPYTYLWSNGATTEDISGLPAGTYTVTVTDANGCTTTASASVNNTGGPTVTVTSTTNVLCFGASTGSINITVSGGTAPYTYLWSNGSTTEDISGLAAGTYSVAVTDNNGCTTSASATITQPTAITASATSTNATCGASNGSVNLTVSGGTSSYTYLWSNGATTEDISGLAAGTYTVTVTDANGCTATASATVNTTSGPTATVTSTTNVLCFGQSTGSINLSVSGGTSPYTYLWSNAATTEDISGLAAGTYSVTVTDANSCTTTVSATITQPASALTASATATNATCGNPNGSVNLTVTGGTSPYTYLWSNGAITEDISGLPSGTYSVTVTDANGCTTTASATVNNITAPGAVAVATNATCGASNGSVNLTVTGGTSPYTYLWSNGATTEDISSLAAGTYSVTITDANGCTANASAAVNNIAGPGATAVAINATCGASNGSVNLTVTGGTSPYTYLWSNGATTEDISGLAAGTYTVTVTDINGCTATTSAIVNNIAGPGASVTATNVLCFGQSTGSVNLTVTGGTSPYTYLWSNGATTEDISGLVAGTYTVTVTDANGCTATGSATVNQPASPVAANATATNATCGNPNGSVNLTVTGGTSPYTYLWSNGATTEDISGLPAGTYTVTVTDANGCTATASATVNNIAGPTVTVTSTTNVLCFGASTGSINITVTGGTSPYTYLWSNGATTEDISGLAAGTYTVTVTDANACTATANATITQPTQLIVSQTHTPIACFGGNSTVTINATGGTPSYSGTGTFIRTAGTYNFTVTDANGCTANTSVTITQPTQLTVSATYTAITCFAGNSTVTITATGGTAPYTGTGTFIRPAGTHNFTVTDANGCTSVTSITIAQPPALVAASLAGTIACNGGNTTVTVTATGGTPPYTGTGTFTRSAGAYSFTVTDANGCTSVTSGVIIQPAVLVAVASAGTIACNGGTATIIITATGGTAPYTGTGTFSRGPGTWSFTVTDARACTSVISVTITEPSVLTASSSAAPIIQCGQTTVVTVTALGGTTPYPYPGVGTYIRGPGTWDFTVTDAAGCTASTQITIVAPDCLKVYPNPARSIIYVNHSKAKKGTTINLFDISGRRVMTRLVQENTILTTIDISRLAGGSYILAFYNEGEIRKIRFEIQ